MEYNLLVLEFFELNQGEEARRRLVRLKTTGRFPARSALNQLDGDATLACRIPQLSSIQRKQ
jgi:hypothetical protein